MKTKKIILFVIIIAFLGSCGKFLEPYPNGNYDSESMWQYQALVQGLIGYCYDQVNSNNRNYADNEGVYLDGATDDAVVTSSTHVMSRYAVNSMTTSQDPFATYWDRDYRAIRNCNLFLKDRRGYNTKFIINQPAPVLDRWNNLVRNRLQGEAFALRAYFEWDLLQRFGGMGANGLMLGFPIITSVYNATDVVNFGRNPYDDCVKQIIADCDSAWKYLPIAHRDFLANAADLSYSGGKYWGRFDGITTRAIKAMVYLTWASPRFNPGNVIARWDSAAANAKSVIDFKMNKDATTSANSFKPANAVVWTNPNSPEIVFSTRYNGSNTTIERLFYPGSFAGTASVGATQELVNAFPMSNGRPITDPLSGYDAAKPYVGRDPRFYSTIFYNTVKANRNNDITKPMYTFECWNAGPTVGKDAAGTKSDNNRTNYYIKKYVFMGWNNSDQPVVSTNHSKFIYRWAHMMLVFAEAANKVVGPLDQTKYGMSARTAIQYLRARKTYDGADGVCPVAPPAVPTAAQDPTLINTAAAGADAFDALIRNERRIETCFEGLRFYDLRRWTTDANWESVLNLPVHGAYITQVTASPATYTYNLNFQVEERKFPSPWNPIPYTEMLRMSNLIQNDGWANWN